MNGYRNGGGGGGSAELDGPANSGNVTSSGLHWKLGLLHSRGRYLTAETFGFKINATGTALRKKQLWTIEYDSSHDDTVYIRSHLGRYLSGDRRGNAACCSDELTEAEKFSVECHPDGSGRWAIRNRATGFYFGGNDERLICHEKQPTADDWWTPHFAFPPQVNLRSVHRQKYACLYLPSEDDDHEDTDSVRISTLIPWGWRALFSLEFVSGRYAIRTNDDRYLVRDGSLVSGPPPPDATFAVELKAGGAGLAFRDRSGRYLTGVGRDAVVQTRNSSAGKDELFVVEQGHPQVVITAHNGRMVSIKQGVDPTANQDDDQAATERETFQLEFDVVAEQWRVRTSDNQYWSVESASGIQATGTAQGVKGLFAIDWQPDGLATLRSASNGRYVTARLNGSLQASVDHSSVADRERFMLTLTNRPRLFLKCDHGYVGVKSSASPARAECNRAFSDPVTLVPVRQMLKNDNSGHSAAAYYLQGSNGRYWAVDVGDCGITVDSAEPQPFIVELHRRARLAIRCSSSGNYISGEQNGSISAKYVDLERATLWDY